MWSLTDAQTSIIGSLNNGPDRLDPRLFQGSPDRILLGLKAHANTINHARIVALEETFRFTRQHLGDATFNTLAREFVETDAARASDTNRIGSGFPDFLSHAATIELAKIEWASLESYHAAEAISLTLADIAALDEALLLALRVAAHPSARLVPVTHPIGAALVELAGQHPWAVLIVRPDAHVRLVSLNEGETKIFLATQENNATLGNLLAVAIEQAEEADPCGPVMTLIGAGALIAGG